MYILKQKLHLELHISNRKNRLGAPRALAAAEWLQEGSRFLRVSRAPEVPNTRGGGALRKILGFSSHRALVLYASDSLSLYNVITRYELFPQNTISYPPTPLPCQFSTFSGVTLPARICHLFEPKNP